MKSHFVTFYSPGTLIAEQTEKPIESWDVAEAKRMAARIKERHGATPYGFRFTTRGRSDNDLDSRVIKSSPMYYLGGTVETLAQVKKRGDKKDAVLISNMEGNGYKRIITNENSWRWTQPLNDDDVVLSWP